MAKTPRPPWGREPEVLSYIAEVVGDPKRARQEYLDAARAGEIEPYARPTLMSHTRMPVPRAEWWRCEWHDLRVENASGFIFTGYGLPGWHDREVRWAEVEARWPRPPHLDVIVKRQSAINAAIDRGERAENMTGGWKDIAKIIRADAGVTGTPRGWGDKQIQRDFIAELKRRGQWH